MTTRRPSLPVPKGGFKNNCDDARWLADTVTMRINEQLEAAGVHFSFGDPNDSLYRLLLQVLDDAAARGGQAQPH